MSVSILEWRNRLKYNKIIVTNTRSDKNVERYKGIFNFKSEFDYMDDFWKWQMLSYGV